MTRATATTAPHRAPVVQSISQTVVGRPDAAASSIPWRTCRRAASQKGADAPATTRNFSSASTARAAPRRPIGLRPLAPFHRSEGALGRRCPRQPGRNGACGPGRLGEHPAAARRLPTGARHPRAAVPVPDVPGNARVGVVARDRVFGRRGVGRAAIGHTPPFPEPVGLEPRPARAGHPRQASTRLTRGPVPRLHAARAPCAEGAPHTRPTPMSDRARPAGPGFREHECHALRRVPVGQLAQHPGMRRTSRITARAATNPVARGTSLSTAGHPVVQRHTQKRAPASIRRPGPWFIERWAGLAPASPHRKWGAFPWTTNAGPAGARCGRGLKIQYSASPGLRETRDLSTRTQKPSFPSL